MTATGQGQDAPSGTPALQSRFLLSFDTELEPVQSVGARQIYIVKGGEFSGPRLKGTVLPGGGDWAQRRDAGGLKLDVRATLKTDDDELIYVQYRGLIVPRPPDQGGLYFRTTPYFETGSEKYSWLNKLIAVGVGKSVPGKVAYDVHEIL